MLKKMREGRQEPARGRREITGSGQYSAVKKIIARQGYQDSASGTRVYRFRTVFCCGKKSLRQGYQDRLHQGRGFTGSGQYFAVKKIIAARLPGQCRFRDEGFRDEGLGSRQYSAVEKNHCGKATRTVQQGRGFTGSGQYSAVKKIIAARLPGQCIRDEGLQVQDSILL